MSNIPEEITDGADIVRLFRRNRAPRWLSVLAAVFGGLAAVSVIIRILLELSPTDAEVFYRYVTRHIQGFFSLVTSALPFSLAETLIVMLPIAVVLIMARYIVAIIRCEKKVERCIELALLTVVCYCITVYMLGLSVLYCRPSLSELSGIENSPVSAETLRAALDRMADGIEVCRSDESFVFTEKGSVCPYSFDVLSERIEDAYGEFSEKNTWLSDYRANAKQIAMSGLMTYTHLSGVYTPYTGEANVNVNYPDFVVVSSMAHEKAHQKGIAPENEANVLAMIVLCESGDPYLEYCGYMSVYSELLGAYYTADPSGYLDYVRTTLPMIAVYEYDAYSAFFDKYRTSTAARVADTVNDTYLKVNGEVHGTRSYGMVVDMAARYFASDN